MQAKIMVVGGDEPIYKSVGYWNVLEQLREFADKIPPSQLKVKPGNPMKIVCIECGRGDQLRKFGTGYKCKKCFGEGRYTDGQQTAGDKPHTNTINETRDRF